MGYILPQTFINALTGVDLRPLPAGELQHYIDRAASDIDKFCGWSFGPQAALTETLRQSGYGRARIDNSGFVSLYPLRLHPINSVTSLTWTCRTPSQPNTRTLNTPATVQTADIEVEQDNFGDGWRIRVYEDFSTYRDPGTALSFTLVYNGGYATTPTWLERASIGWTAGLLKQRGAQAAVMTGTGGMVDVSAIGGDIERAKEALEPFQRKF